MDSNFQYASAVNLVVAPFSRPAAWDGSARPFVDRACISVEIDIACLARPAVGLRPRTGGVYAFSQKIRDRNDYEGGARYHRV